MGSKWGKWWVSGVGGIWGGIGVSERVSGECGGGVSE